jgi:DNA mismatch endonuclease (patch repair protein)
MSKVRSKGNRSTERRIRSLLTRAGLRGWQVQPKGIPGRPDFAFPELRVLLFVDSCFWHGCQHHLRRPKTNKAYWQAKIDSNRRRDRTTTRTLRQDGWRVLRIWEHELTDLGAVLNRVLQALPGAHPTASQ